MINIIKENKKQKKFSEEINNQYLKYMGLSGVDKKGDLRKLYKPPLDPDELTKDIGTYIWDIDPTVIPHLQKYETINGLYYIEDKPISSLQFIPVNNNDIKTNNDVQTYIDNTYSYIDKLYEYPYKLFNMHHRNIYKGYNLDYSKEIMDATSKDSKKILDIDEEYKQNFKLNEIRNYIKKRIPKKKKCEQIKQINNKLFDDDKSYTEANKDNYYTDIGLDFKQKQSLLLNKERRCDNIHKVLGTIDKNNKKNKILLQDLLINLNSNSKQLLFGNRPFVNKYSNNKKIIIDPFIDQFLQLSFLAYNKMINKAIVPCINNHSDLLFNCRVLLNLNLNYNYFDNKTENIKNKNLIYIGFFLVRLNDDIKIDINMSDKCKKYYNFKDTYLPESKERYYVLFIYKRNIKIENEDEKLRQKLLFYNYYVINYRCNFVNMGEITEYKRVLYTEIEQIICMNTKNNAYLYILLKINQKRNIINVNNQCNHILESNSLKKKNKDCIESNFHKSFINLLNLNNISYYSDNYKDKDTTIYEQHLLISKIEYISIFYKLNELLEKQKRTALNICKEFITNIRSIIYFNKYSIDNKFINNDLNNDDDLYYILDNINDIHIYINDNLISKCIKKINKYYTIYLELSNIKISKEKLINDDDEKPYIKIYINDDEVYALLPCHFDWASNNLELDKLSYEITKLRKKLYDELSKTEDKNKIIKINKIIKRIYFKERLYIKYGDMPQNKKDIYDACIEKECIDKIDKKRFTKIATKLQISPRVAQYFKDVKNNINEIFLDSNLI